MGMWEGEADHHISTGILGRRLAIATFAAGLKQDGPAVRAALTTLWSSGQSEGQITRLKLLKPQTYGRASFDLLRRRTLLAA
jgi:transposase